MRRERDEPCSILRESSGEPSFDHGKQLHTKAEETLDQTNEAILSANGEDRVNIRWREGIR